MRWLAAQMHGLVGHVRSGMRRSLNTFAQSAASPAEFVGPSAGASTAAFSGTSSAASTGSFGSFPLRAWRATCAVVAAVLLLAGAWAWIGHLDVLVRAPVRVVIEGQLKTLSSAETARVAAIHVSEGQWVDAGAALVDLETGRGRAELDRLLAQQAAWKLQSQCAQALIDLVRSRDAMDRGDPGAPVYESVGTAKGDISDWQASIMRGHLSVLPPFDRQTAWSLVERQFSDVRARLDQLEQNRARLLVQGGFARQRAEDLQQLLDVQFVSRHAWLDRQQQALDWEAQISSLGRERAALIARSLREAQETVVLAQRNMQQAAHEARVIEAGLQQSRMVAPVAGRVHQLQVHTVGGVVAAAQPVVQIIPEPAQLELEALVDHRDIAFVRVGQSARVRLDAIDYTRYGALPVEVVQVAGHAVSQQDGGASYPVRLRAPSWQGPALLPGMRGTADLRTGDRRLLTFFLSLFVRTGHEALRER